MVTKGIPSNYYWPKFDKSWPFSRGNASSKKVAFAATNFSFDAFEKGYQGSESFHYFNFPIDHLMQLSEPRSQAEFIASRLCAHQLLFDFAVHHDFLESDANNAPIWPKGIVGGISHCYPYVVAMIGKAKDYQAIGVDLSSKISAELCANVSQSILTDDERLRFPDFLNEQRLRTIFSLKKCFQKAFCELALCHIYFEDIQVTQLDMQNGEAQLELNKDLSYGWKKGSRVIAEIDFYASQVISLILVPKRATQEPNLYFISD